MNIRRAKVEIYVVIGALILIPVVWYVFWRSMPVEVEPIQKSVESESVESRHDPRPSSVTVLAQGALEEVATRVSGDVLVLQGDGAYLARLEDIAIEDCQQCFVYFSDNDELDGLTNLGELRAKVGDMNYEVPIGTNVRAFEEVLIWDEAAEKIVARAALVWSE